RLELAELLRTEVDPVSDQHALAIMAEVYWWLEDFGAAKKLITFVIESLRQRGASAAFAFALIIRSDVGFRTGQWSSAYADAVEHLENAWQIAADHGLSHPGVVPFVADLVEARIRCGDARRAEELLAWLEERGDTMGLVYAAAAVHRCRGLLAHGVDEALSE